ncbi:MAG TPA: hypothetical protein VMA34_21260 [Terracidiphilus sp.]|nr:hypothetical protein [Terracidiphilus sp.]
MRSEVRQLIDGGRVEDTIHFAAGAQARLTYAVECAGNADRVLLRFAPGEVTVVLPPDLAQPWAGSGEVGVYASIAVGTDATLEVAIEKDFACLDRAGAGNEDTYSNPLAGIVYDDRQCR